MSDERLRALERAAQDDPEARARFEAERIRMGLGWHGEVLPEGVRPTEERGVYAWGLGPRDVATIELVYVPGGDCGECDRCFHAWQRVNDRLGAGLGQRPEPRTRCRACDDTGVRKVAPFYLGRFPVTWRQFLRFVDATNRSAPLGPSWWERPGRWPPPEAEHMGMAEAIYLADHPERGLHPVVNVTRDDAHTFSRWAGLRLPDSREWRWAAIREHEPCPGRAALAHWSSCLTCGGPGGWQPTGFVMRQPYPWGHESPSKKRCALTTTVYEWTGGTRQVVDCRFCVMGTCYTRNDHVEGMGLQLVPVRHRGASWCGAIDMVGNVEEWTVDGLALGGSFRHSLEGQGARVWMQSRDVHEGELEECGFRVALDAVPA